MAGDVEELLTEHLASWRQYAAAQQRCSAVISAQHARIVQLEAQLLRARAAAVVQCTARAWAEDGDMKQPTRVVLRQRVELFMVHMQALLHWRQPGQACAEPQHDTDAQALEDSLVAADLVICQTGCLSHGDYWRVQDHCRRTGKACVLVEQPDALRIVRLDRTPGNA